MGRLLRTGNAIREKERYECPTGRGALRYLSEPGIWDKAGGKEIKDEEPEKSPDAKESFGIEGNIRKI